MQKAIINMLAYLNRIFKFNEIRTPHIENFRIVIFSFLALIISWWAASLIYKPYKVICIICLKNSTKNTFKCPNLWSDYSFAFVCLLILDNK